MCPISPRACPRACIMDAKPRPFPLPATGAGFKRRSKKEGLGLINSIESEPILLLGCCGVKVVGLKPTACEACPRAHQIIKSGGKKKVFDFKRRGGGGDGSFNGNPSSVMTHHTRRLCTPHDAWMVRTPAPGQGQPVRVSDRQLMNPELSRADAARDGGSTNAAAHYHAVR